MNDPMTTFGSWTPDVSPVMSFGDWKTNGDLIADVARLGYLRSDDLTLDCTYGKGRFWSRWRPDRLIRFDLDQRKGLDGIADFRYLPFRTRCFDAVVFDPPYKLNGTPSGNDEDYGVHLPTRWQDRMALIELGTEECCMTVRPGGVLLVKCQDQVCSGQMRWQTDLVTEAAIDMGFDKVDRLDMPSYRQQPDGRSQKHARHNSSQLLVFRRRK
jgi:hypothetical protein